MMSTSRQITCGNVKFRAYLESVNEEAKCIYESCHSVILSVYFPSSGKKKCGNLSTKLLPLKDESSLPLYRLKI